VLGAVFPALAAAMLSLPAGAMLALTLAAGKRSGNPVAPPGRVNCGQRVAVLVPAHNESRNVLPTIACLLPQMRAGDRLVVVADNCSDDTAQLARDAGATVIERHNAELRGKGYALAFGVDSLRADPPDVVMVVDADCTVTVDAVERISSYCLQTRCPVQMLNLMQAGPDSSVRLRILEFAFVIKNMVRPLGSQRLGGACHLTGTGMALPWALIATAQLATGHIVEDMKLGVDMAIIGHPAQFYPDAKTSSTFPDDSKAARVQKSRWEHGQLSTQIEELPRVTWAALRSGRAALYVLALDLLIPPLALYALVLGAALVLACAGGLLWPLLVPAATVLGIATLAFIGSVGLAWLRYGRHLLSTRELLAIPLYALWKIPVYLAYAMRRPSGWVRTKRDSE
jgi:cellulose synthase/poly-beta-1,6-N-acetylglucosamine synthase-like glycosyltransferase